MDYAPQKPSLNYTASNVVKVGASPKCILFVWPAGLHLRSLSKADMPSTELPLVYLNSHDMLPTRQDRLSNATVEDDFPQAYAGVVVHPHGVAAPGGTGARNALPAAHGDGQRAHASGPARRQRSHQQLQGRVSRQAGADSLGHEGPGAAPHR